MQVVPGWKKKQVKLEKKQEFLHALQVSAIEERVGTYGTDLKTLHN